MKLLVTGNQGYLGPVVCRHLRSAFPQAEITGFDAGYFADCWTVDDHSKLDEAHRQFTGDLREFPENLLKGIDAVVHLGAISNDPMGKRFEDVTRAVNFEASVRLASLARKAGVRSFVFASSCSVYGMDDGTLKNENSPVSPLTAYARSKIQTEAELAKLAGPGFTVTALRFATACGFSPRCRLDLVLNDFVASALTHGKITLLSDGTPWRPLIHVIDMASAMEWAITRTQDAGAFLAINAGSEEWNFRIRDLAQSVARELGGVPVQMNKEAGPDKRSYRVDFTLFSELAPRHQPSWSLDEAVKELATGLRPVLKKGEDFRTSKLIRLQTLSTLIDRGALDSNLHWSLRAA